jgi:Fe-S-cluster containining protein
MLLQTILYFYCSLNYYINISFFIIKYLVMLIKKEKPSFFMPVSQNFLTTCEQCQAFCCKLVKPPITEKEKDDIVNAGFADHFICIDKGIYAIQSTKNNLCPYLKKDYSCEIHQVKPALCRIWPVIPRYKNNKRSCIILHCPLYTSLTKKEINQAKQEANTIPIPILEHLWNISPETKQKYKRYTYKEL